MIALKRKAVFLGQQTYHLNARVQSLQQPSIMRSFDPEELRKPLPAELLKELEWEAQMDEDTRLRYSHLE
jgi:hypothetical protein